MTTTSPPDLDVVVARRLLSLGLAPPTDETLDAVGELAYALAGRPHLPEAQELLEALEAERERLPQAYQALFGGEVAISPYEGGWEQDPFRQARQMADVAGFYRAFGADAGGPASERVDHAGTELEFLAFLGARRLAAAEEGHDEDAERCLAIEEAFLTDHAGRWLPAFCDELAAAPVSAFYAALGRLGGRLLREELAARGLRPEPLTRRRARLQVEEDSFECAGEGELGGLVGAPAPKRRRRRRA